MKRQDDHRKKTGLMAGPQKTALRKKGLSVQAARKYYRGRNHR